MKNYSVGNGAQQITLDVNITTIGLAATRAVVGIPGSGTPTPVAHSSNATGDIPSTSIGLPADLQGKTLSVMTKVDLSIIQDANDRQKEFERITSAVTLNNGADGNKTFPPDIKQNSDDYATAIISTMVKFT